MTFFCVKMELPKLVKGGIALKTKGKNLIFKFGGIIASLALLVTSTNISTTCFWLGHQPKLPQGADKLRKY